MFITVVLILVIIILFIRLLFAAIFRLLFGWTRIFRRKKDKKADYKKGKTTIISHGKDRSEVPKNFGDYIDYVEVKNEDEK
jgi:hypothetical protein